MVSKITVAVVLVFVAIGVYYATLPVPDGLPSPWTLRGMTAAFGLTSPLPVSLKCMILKALRGDYFQAVTRNVTDTHFDGIPVRIYQPLQKSKSLLPAVVYFHGGGWVRWSVDFHHGPVNSLATSIGDVVVISVEYRLAPENIFPAAIDDCTTAVVSLMRNAEAYGVDPKRIAVMGDSAGGNLAAAVSQRFTFDAKYKDMDKIKLQVLIYPCLQALDFNLPSYHQNGHHVAIPLSKNRMMWYWSLYLHGNDKLVKYFATNNHTSSGIKRGPFAKFVSHDLIPNEFKYGDYVDPNRTSLQYGDDDVYVSIRDTLMDPDFAPLMRKNLAGLPKAYILTSQFDVLRDDGILYAKRLEEAEVRVTWKHYEGGHHGMTTDNADYGTFNLWYIDVAEKANNELVQYVKKNL